MKMKSFKNKWQLAILALLFSASFYAQNKVEGVLLDHKKEPVPFAPVLLMTAIDTLKLDYTVTDNKGKFLFLPKQTGTYYVKVKVIGYKEFKSKEFNINNSNQETKILDAIFLEENTTQLKEVVVVSKKPLFTQKVDRLVFNVENSLASQGGDAIEALKSTPLLKVDEGSITMIGKSGLNILINGRPITLTGEALISYLGTISNDAISKIEIITTPPAKYAAEGNAGLINIILKTNPNLGWNASLATSVTQRTNLSSRNTALFNYQTEKFSLTSNLLYSGTNMVAYEKDQNTFNDGFFSTNRQDKVMKSNNLTPSINLNYKLNPKTDITFLYEFNNSDFTSDDASKSLFYEKGMITNELQNKGFVEVRSDFNRVHSFLTKELDTIGKSVELGFQFLDNAIKNERNNNIIQNSTAAATQNVSSNDYKLGIANLDFNLPFKKVKWVTGAQYTFLDNKSDVRFFDIINSNPQLNPALTNAFNYKENIWATYASAEMKLNEKWTVQAGIRYENTDYEGKSVGSTNTIKRNYGNFFPTFYSNYKYSEKADYSFKYSKRVNRPKLEQLNPFQWYINPFQYVEGNPLLQPSFTDNFEVTYANNSNFSATIYHSITKDQVSYFAEFLEEGKVQRYSYYNILDVNQYGMYANYTFSKIKNLQMQLSGSYFWQETKSEKEDVLPSTDGSGSNVSINNSYKFGKNCLLQLNYVHNFPSFDGTFTTDSYGFLTVGYRTNFMDKKVTLGLTASTIISKKSEVAYSQLRNNASINGQNEYDYQSVRLNIAYKFGNTKVKGSKTKSEVEETSRIK